MKQMKKMLSLLLVCCMMFTALGAATTAYADEDKNTRQTDGYRAIFEYDMSNAKVYNDCNVEIYTTSECTHTTDEPYARNLKTGEIDSSGNGDILFHVGVSPWSWFEVYADGDYDEVEYGDYNFVKITGVKSDVAVLIEVGDNNSIDTDDSDEEVGVVAGYKVEFNTEKGISIKHKGNPIPDNGIIYTDDIIYNGFDGENAEKKDITFAVEDNKDDSAEYSVNIRGDYEKLVDNFNGTYTIQGITSDLAVEIEKAYGSDLVNGHKITFVYDEESFSVTDNNFDIIGNGSTVYTNKINTKEETSPYPKDYTFRAYDYLSWGINTKVTVNGDYSEITVDDYIYTVKGITSDITIDIVADDTRKNITNALNDFSANFFRLTYQKETDKKNGSNIIVSPLSLYTDVALLENGTANKTQTEILAMLTSGNENISENALNEYIKNYLDYTSKNDVVDIANSVYISNRDDIIVNPQFVDTAHNYYNAEVFRATPDADLVKRINRWASDNTNQAIKKVLNNDEISKMTNSILLNAIAFDGKWKKQFEDNQIKTGKFTNYNGSKTDVDFLNGNDDYFYNDGKSLAFTKPYENGYSFMAILPNEDIGIDKYIESMDGSTISNLLSYGYYADVRTKIPKFEFDNDFVLNETMEKMGMVEAFKPFDADLSRLAPSEYEFRNTFVSLVKQVTHVKLDEKGTKAEAVTVIINDDTDVDTDIERKQVDIFLDRPFVFVIYDDENKAPVFVGTVGDMSGNEGTDNNNTAEHTDEPDPGDDWLGLLGDVNGDSKVTGKDSMLIQRYVINLANLSEEQQELADVDGNRRVTNADALIILRYTININVNYNIGDGIYKNQNQDNSYTPDQPEKAESEYYFLVPERFLAPYVDNENQKIVVPNSIGAYWYDENGETDATFHKMQTAFEIETPVYKISVPEGVKSVMFKGYNEDEKDHTDYNDTDPSTKIWLQFTDILDLEGHEGMIYLVNQTTSEAETSRGDPYVKAYYMNGGWFSLDPQSNNYYKNSENYDTYKYNILFNDYWTNDGND